jgi:hypothetical protein
MADEKVGLVVKVKVHGEQQLRKLKREINDLNDHVTLLKNRVNANLDSMDARWKKHFDGVDKMVKMMGGALTKFVGMSAKFAAVQLGALGAAMIAVHGAFVLGNAAMKAFRYLAKGVAAGLAAVTVAASTAAAAIRENQAAMFAYKKMGKNEFGSGMNQVRQEMRAMARDTDLAGLSAKDLNSIYSEISKKGTYTQSSQALVKSLMDFGAAGQDVAKGAQSVGALVGMLQDPKATFAQITNSAKDLGPAMENALKEAKTKGIDTVAKLKVAILDGTLSVIGGVNGQFAAVNDTLIGRFKKAMNIIKADFGDFGQVFLGPSKDALSEIEHTIRRTLVQVSGSITTFGKGSMLDGLTSGFAKLADGFGNMINNYLPKAQGMLKSVGDWWGRFKSGWNDVLDRTRPFIDAAKVLENMLGNILQPMFSQFGNAMDHTRQLILDNKGAFEEFGSRVGNFISEFGRYASTVRDVFVDALPFINQIVDGATSLFHMFNNILGVAKSFAGFGGAGGSFGLAGGLMAAGRGMKKTIGGVVPDYAKMQKAQLMSVKADVVNVDGPGGGMASRTGGGGGGIGSGGIAGGGGARSINGYPMAVNQLQAGSGLYGAGHPMSPLRQQGMRSQVGVDNTGGGAPTGTGVTPAGGREIAPGYVSGPHNRGIYETASGRKLSMRDGGYWKAMFTPHTPGYSQSVEGVDPGRLKKFSGKYGPRAWRTTEAYGRMFGDEKKGFKGYNNSATAGITATLGLGLLSSIAPESSKGALALGSGVAMFNPMAGLAVGGLGAAATGTSPAFGALTGAMGGVAAGSFLGAPGMIVGAIVGALAGGIMGAINKRKEEYKAARNAGRQIAETMQSQMFSGISSVVGNAASQGAAKTRNVIESNLASIISTNTGYVSELQADISGVDANGSEALKLKMEDQYTKSTGIYGAMTQTEYDAAMKQPKATAEEMMREFTRTAAAAQGIQTVYDNRMDAFQRMFGATQDEIFSMAQASGLNLLEVTMDFDSARRMLISGLINDTQTLNSFVGETFATMYDSFDKASRAAKAPLIYDEGARTIYDKSKANTLQNSDIQDFMGMATQQFPAMYGSGVGGLYAFRDQFYGRKDPITGKEIVAPTAFGLGPDGKPVPLTGQRDRFEATPGFNEAGVTNQSALAKAGKELVQSSLATAGLGFTDPGVLMNIGASFANLPSEVGTKAITDLAAKTDQYNLATDDLGRQKIQEEIKTYVQGVLGPILGVNLQTAEIDTQSTDTAALMADSVKQGIIDAFKPGFTLNAGPTKLITDYFQAEAGVVNVTEVGSGDTRLNKSNAMDSRLGDTATNLSNTLDAHNRLNTGAGNRFITSSYRNYSLGSSNSDHINGRAYDLVGDNLISYRDAVNRDGGFAQFHGDTENRHLHVVPRIGDSMSPAYAMVTSVGSATSSQSSGAPVYNITVNGAGSNPEEIANMVMHKIKINEKISKERAY